MEKSKGNRIRASDKSLVYHFCIGWLLLLFVAVFLLLNLRQLLITDWKVVHRGKQRTVKAHDQTRTLRWIQRQVDPTLKMLETITAKTGVDYLKEIRKPTKLTEKHYKIIEQQTTSTEDVILEKEN